MKTAKIAILAMFLAATGSAIAAEGEQARETLMQKEQAQFQERVGANGEKDHRQMEQKREQMKNRYRYEHRNQLREGSGHRIQQRMMHR
jgi:hypothetical protein